MLEVSKQLSLKKKDKTMATNPKLADAFNLSTEETAPVQLEDAPVVPSKNAVPLTKQDTVTDIDYARRVLQFNIEKAQQLVDLAIDNAASAASPRDIEVAANALNTCAGLSEKLVNLYASIKALLEKEKAANNTVINNNKTLVLSSSELLKALIDEKDSHENG